MIFYKIVFILLAICSCKIVCNGKEIVDESPIIELKQGKLKGIQEISSHGKEFYSFMGIPFAKPPVQNLRFEAPERPEAWDGILEADKMPEMCLQVTIKNAIKGRLIISGSEDCLYLNVFTPKPLKGEANLPVMVYIHGGAFTRGSASLHPPHFMLNEEIVLVVIQYRLGVFGFLSTEDSAMPGNMGLKDQRMALQWVQENIRNFGGDPDQVTIFGESAGSGSVHLQMLSPGSKGLFKRVIAQSGTGLCPWCVSNQHRTYAKTYGEKIECKLDELGSKAFKQCLKEHYQIPLMYQMGFSYKWGNTPMVTVPRVDGDFLPDDPAVLLKTGRYNKVDLMAGLMRDEGAFFSIPLYAKPLLKKALVEEFDKYSPYSLLIDSEVDSANLSKRIYDFYLKEKKIDGEDLMDELTEMFGHRYFHVCIDLAALMHAKDSDINLYLYEFNYLGKRTLLDAYGVDFDKKYISHGDDLFYLFETGLGLDNPLENEEDLAISKKIVQLWTNFAKFGNPTPKGSFDFTWKPATDKDFEHLSIETIPTMKGYTRKRMLDFWKTIDTRQNQILSGSQSETKDEL